MNEQPTTPPAILASAARPFSEAERAQAIETLSEWLLHDTWTLRQGLFLLVGIDPLRSDDLISVPEGDGSKMGMRSAPNPTWAMITKSPTAELDEAGELRMAGYVFDPASLIALHALLSLWASNPEHPRDWQSRYKPAYFIGWARSKGRPPFWLEWLPDQRRASVVDPAGASDQPIKAPEERQARRLAAFLAAGGQVPRGSSGRWRGVTKVAEQLGITRQTLTDDLKAAIEREREQRRGGGALDPARLGL